MVGFNEELYSIMFGALRHSVRREILFMLAEEQKSFTELYETIGISSSHLSYHLDALDGLIIKKETKYQLTGSGKTAINMLNKTESSSKYSAVNIFSKYLAIILFVLMVGMINYYINDYQVSVEIIRRGFIDAFYGFIYPIIPVVIITSGIEYWKIPVNTIAIERIPNL